MIERPTLPRRRLALLGAAVLALAAPWSFGQVVPSRPIRLVVNFPPGGAADVIGRALARQLALQFGQPVVVENRPGANGNLGADAVAKSPADGTVLLMSSGGAVTVNPFLYKKMTFDAEQDLVPVASVARVLVFLLVHPSVPATTAREFIAYARAHPGELTFGSAGAGSGPHLAGEMFARQAGFRAVHVPYKGAAPALADLLAGQVQFLFDPGPGLRHVKDGRLRLLAVGSPKRSAQWPDTPTLAEVGLAGFDADTLFGVYAPRGTPATTVTQLHGAIDRALSAPQVAGAIRDIGGEVAALSRAEFIDRLRHDRERYGAFIREAGLKVE